MKRLIIILLLLLLAGGYAFTKLRVTEEGSNKVNNPISKTSQTTTSVESKTDSTITEENLEKSLQTPSKKVLNNDYHIFQTFNNCGPASMSMALSYYGINVSQQVLGRELRPYQIPSGDNDDKSVTLKELAKLAADYDLVAYHRPNGNIEVIKGLISLDLPIVTRTWLKPNDDIGHYRVIKGYDDVNKTITQDDSLQGNNLVYSYDEFNEIWKMFNYEYLVLVPSNKVEAVENILKENVDERTSWEIAANNAKDQLKSNPNDVYTRFNLSVAYSNLGMHNQAVKEFEQVEDKISKRTLWYQIEPIESYYELENYDKVFEITNKILNNQNRAFSELYILRGKSYEKLGKIQEAKSEYEKAIVYNINLEEPRTLLNNLN